MVDRFTPLVELEFEEFTMNNVSIISSFNLLKTICTYHKFRPQLIQTQVKKRLKFKNPKSRIQELTEKSWISIDPKPWLYLNLL